MIIRKIELETLIGTHDCEIKQNDWIAYGHSDKVSISIIEQHTSLLSSIYENIVNTQTGLIQNFYLLFNKDNKDKEKEFWNRAYESNFCGIYFVTTNQKEQLKEIKSILCSAEFVDFFAYDTLDDYDLIITCIGDCFEEIEDKVTNIIHKNNFTINNVYKLFITSYTKLNSYKCPCYISESPKNLSYKVQISIRNSREVNDSKAFNTKEFKNFINELKNLNTKINLQDISGSQNIMLLFQETNVYDLYSLYKTENPIGIFAVNSKYRNSVIKSTNLKFLVDIKESYYTCITNEKKNKNVITFNKERYVKYRISKFYEMQILRICYSINNIYNQNLSDFTFMSLYFSLKKFIEKLDNLIDVPYEKTKESIELYLETCREILNINNATQIGYYPKQEYMSKEVFAPSKLISFYSMFLVEMTENVLQNETKPSKPQFVFCLKPSFKENVSITSLFMIDEQINNRLLLVDIPMKYIYDQKIMLFSLCHEASHFNSEVVRCREFRANAILKSYFIILLDILFENIEENKVKKYSLDKYLYNKFKDITHKYLDMYDLKYYSITLKKVLHSTTFDILADISFSMKNIFEYQEQSELTVYEQSLEMLDIMDKIKKNARQLLFKNEYTTNINNLIDLFSEIFADFFAIKYLDCDIELYSEIMLKTYNVLDLDEIKSDFTILRMLTMYLTVFKSNIKDKLVSINFQNKIEKYVNYKKANFRDTIDGISVFFGNPAILDNLIQYIDECEIEYTNIFGENTLSKLSDIRNIVKNGIFNYEIINNYNDQFRKIIEKDIEENKNGRAS